MNISAGMERKPIAIRRRLPGLGPIPNYSQALYPDPPSHDFVTWMVIAELMRRYHQAPAPLKVRFLLDKGQLGVVDYSHYSLRAGKAYECGVTKAYSDQMIANVLRPAIDMMGAVNEPDLDMATVTREELERYVEYDYHIGHLVDAGRQGYEIPRFKPPAWAEEEARNIVGDGPPPVIITLRETSVQPERNSDIDAWVRFASSIKGKHPVLFVRDTAKADEPLSEWPTCPRASVNAYVRTALYRMAYCNLMVCNGPVNWCMFTDAPILIFKQFVPALPTWAAGHPHGWRDQCHMEVGDQLPWSSPLQRFTWTDDGFEHIRAAFEEFETRCCTYEVRAD